ncbi:hypothetical protein [Myceligenerans crystallogenes]|uniref:Uncharacterized protein n=1 Tax=Myceligenerans crystallogenes TaxID=316335 RepID=A0ABN2NAW2_9MICO
MTEGNEIGDGPDDAGAAREPGSGAAAAPAGEPDGAGGSLADVVASEKDGRSISRTTLTVAVLVCLLGVALVAYAPTFIRAIAGGSTQERTPAVVADGGSQGLTASASASPDARRESGKPGEGGTKPRDAKGEGGGGALPTEEAGGGEATATSSGADQDQDDAANPGTDAVAPTGSAGDSGESGETAGAGDGGTQSGGESGDPGDSGSGSGDPAEPVSTTRTCGNCTYQGFGGAQVQLRPKWRVVDDTVQMAVDWRNADVGYAFDVKLELGGEFVHGVRYEGYTPTPSGSTPWYTVDASLSKSSGYTVAIGNPKPDRGTYWYTTPFPESPPFTY